MVLYTICHASRRSPYDDQSLGSGEIRLLTVEREPSLQHVFPWLPDQPLSLTTTVHELDDEPDFYALSYVWGPAPPSISVSCNGSSLFVTQSAYEILNIALQTGETIWIDAICIDQSNPREKAIQIPLMKTIYANATAVVMYLGASNPMSDAFMSDFPRVYELSLSWAPTAYNPDPDWRGEGWPREDDDFWVGLYQLLNHDWFRRLWTFQEAVLAGNATLLCGLRWIDANDFINFILRGQNRPDPYIVQNDAIAARISGKPALSSLAFIACGTIASFRQTEPLYEREYWLVQLFMPKLLNETGMLNVTEPADKVWGIAGLMGQTLQNALAPIVDYSEQGRTEYWRTYHQFNLKTLVEAKSFAPLTLVGSVKPSNNRLPSWCLDLAGEPLTLLHLDSNWNLATVYGYAGYANFQYEHDHEDKAVARALAITSHTLISISTTDNDRILLTRGFVVDNITEVVDDPCLVGQIDYCYKGTWLDWTTDNPIHVAVLAFYNRVGQLARRLDPACKEDEIPMEFIICMLTDWRVTAEVQQIYQDAWSCINDGGYAHFLGLEDADRRRKAWEAVRNLIRITGHSFFATEKGRLGIATPGCKVGDRVCCFYGGMNLYLLRDVEKEESLASGERAEKLFVGVAFVNGWMEQSERDDARLEDDEIFRIQ
ncbi:heterokaryon incompatibility protein-domain-containing protein [Phaeosphaeria sp. MPI-PUGE-AT-0046c]|nr:heterokaryon incompatibility protein-domain-containing protein [Phaeosphaeria sp. MPI-PUGE-AT-0046c]